MAKIQKARVIRVGSVIEQAEGSWFEDDEAEWWEGTKGICAGNPLAAKREGERRSSGK